VAKRVLIYAFPGALGQRRWVMVEKRNHKRAMVDMKISYSDDTHIDKMGKVTDISKGGMYVETGDDPEVIGDLVGVIDNENFGKVIWVEGRLVRKNMKGMALRFTDTDEKGLDNLLISRKALH
jgi:hypothetical protein